MSTPLSQHFCTRAVNFSVKVDVFVVEPSTSRVSGIAVDLGADLDVAELLREVEELLVCSLQVRHLESCV